MLISDMETRIEQILPTLATMIDLERFATKADIEASERRLRLLIEHLSGRVETLDVHLSDQMQRLCDRVERLDRGR